MANSGRKSKYETSVEPYLEAINKKIREGVTEEAIAESLGICVATLNNYKKKHPELAAALRDDKGKDVLEKLVNAGIEAACGRWIEEEVTVVVVDEDGIPSKKQKTFTKKYLPPNPTLNIYYTKVYGKDEGFTNDPAELELKKAKFELDKAVEEVKHWDLNLNFPDNKE